MCVQVSTKSVLAILIVLDNKEVFVWSPDLALMC